MSKNDGERSPHISECSTATNAGMPDGSVATAKPSTSATSNTSVTASTDTTTKSSAISVLGKALSKWLHNFAGRPGDRHGVGSTTNSVRKRSIRRRQASKTYTAAALKKNVPKWVFNCRGCTRPITLQDVKSDNAIYAIKSVWHRSHLVCFKCGVPIGDERRPFVASGPDGKHAVCLDCNMENDHPSCAVCTNPLFETCVEVDDKLMHLGCFVCERCKAPFPGGKYAIFKDKAYDLDCYFLKAYESSFASAAPAVLPESPPPMASMTDSIMSLPTTPISDTSFSRKPTELFSLSDMGLPHPAPKKDLSSENADAELVKALGPKLPPLNLSAEGHIALGPPEIGSKEKFENIGSKETSVSPIKEKLEDFDNGKDEAHKKKDGLKTPEVVALPPLPSPAEIRKPDAIEVAQTVKLPDPSIDASKSDETKKLTDVAPSADAPKTTETPKLPDTETSVVKDAPKPAQTPNPPEALTAAVSNELLKNISNPNDTQGAKLSEPLKPDSNVKPTEASPQEGEKK